MILITQLPIEIVFTPWSHFKNIIPDAESYSRNVRKDFLKRGTSNVNGYSFSIGKVFVVQQD